MKKTGFRKMPYAEIIAKKQAKCAIAKKKPAKRKNTRKKARLPALSTLRNKADALLTPLAKKVHPQCECCGAPTQVGHHWIEKSRSSYLRYAIHNIISLCNSCHAKIHNRFGNNVVGGIDVAEVIISKRGREWKEQLDKEQPTYIKVDRIYYNDAYTNIWKLLNE